jgi:hypothetical protein
MFAILVNVLVIGEFVHSSVFGIMQICSAGGYITSNDISLFISITWFV